MHFDKEKVIAEIQVRSSRSGGSGGQHVNKVSTKITVTFNLMASDALTAEQKQLLTQRLSSKLDRRGNLHISSQETRSQFLNKEVAVEKLLMLLQKALQTDAKRIQTKVPQRVKLQRANDKYHLSRKKSDRQKPKFD